MADSVDGDIGEAASKQASLPSRSDKRAGLALRWGETVRLLSGAADAARPEVLATVVGLRDDAGPEGERTLCLIEFGDGSAVEVDATLLERVTLPNTL
jgi:phage baseplate assembly protein gpV